MKRQCSLHLHDGLNASAAQMKTAAPAVLFFVVVLHSNNFSLSLQQGLHILSAVLLFEPWHFRIYLFLSPLNGLEADQRRCSLHDGQWSSLLLFSNASDSQCSIVIRKSSAQQKELLCGIQHRALVSMTKTFRYCQSLQTTDRETCCAFTNRLGSNCHREVQIIEIDFSTQVSSARHGQTRAMRTSNKLRNFLKS